MQYWAFYQLEPWGGEKEDFRMGIFTSSICNALRQAIGGYMGKPLSAEDFMPKHDISIASDPDLNLAKAKFGAWNDMQSVILQKQRKKEDA